MAGFENDVLLCNNVNFNPNLPKPHPGLITTDGQLIIGSTALNAGGTHLNIGHITSTGGTVTITNGAGTINLEATGGATAITLTGNTGGSLSPIAGNFNTLGSGSITIAGAGATLTTQLTGMTNHAVLVGAGTTTLTKLTVGTDGQVLLGATAADPAFGTLTSADGSIAFTIGANTLDLVVASGAGVGKTITGDSGGALSPTAGNWNIIGASAAAGTSPVVTSGAVSTLTVKVQTSQALAAADATKIGLSNFSNADFAVAATGFVTLASTGAGKTITGNSGGAISPVANNWNTLGTGSITISGAGSTLTTQLTGLTNHAVLVGAGTATITNIGPTATVGQVLQSAGAAADPAFSTATYPLTTTVSQILYSSATNTVTGLATANRAVLTTGTTGIPVMTALATDGQLIIGSTAGAPAAATLTAGSGITITNASNSITIAATGSTPPGYDPFATQFLVDDFIFNYAGTGDTEWRNDLANQLAGEANHPGIVRLGSGVTSTLMKANGDTNCLAYVTGNGAITVDFVCRVGATAAQNIFLGLDNTQAVTTKTEATDGVYFFYNSGTNSGKWVGRCRSGSVNSDANSNNTVTAGAWVRLKLVINAAGNSVSFYVNGSEIANSPVSTHIPAGPLNLRFVGASTAYVDIDLVTASYVMAIPR